MCTIRWYIENQQRQTDETIRGLPKSICLGFLLTTQAQLYRSRYSDVDYLVQFFKARDISMLRTQSKPSSQLLTICGVK